MNTHIQNTWKMPKNPVFLGLFSFVIGSFTGFLAGIPDSHRYACPASTLRAHFLEQRVAYEPSTLHVRPSSSSSLSSSSSSSSPETLRPAASDDTAIVVSSTSSSDAEISSRLSDRSSSSSERPWSSEFMSSVSSTESASSSSAISAAASSSSVPPEIPTTPTDFPAFGNAIYPVARTPNWGAMTTPAEWERSYAEMNREDFVRIPAYRLRELTTPMGDLLATRDDPESIRILTAKLFYSTRYFGSYNLDAGEFSGDHAGIDLKLPEGMPVGAIAGGRVNAVIRMNPAWDYTSSSSIERATKRSTPTVLSFHHKHFIDKITPYWAIGYSKRRN